MRYFLIWLLWAVPAMANPMLIDDFSDASAARWQYVSDRVMGGVSDGRATIGTENDAQFAQLRGTVSTANNGGFIQIRRALPDALPTGSTGLVLRVRGNGAAYYVHLRSKDASRPWQYHQARFETTSQWQEVTLTWDAFAPNGGIPKGFAPQDIRSLGVVAYGADYEAQIDVDWIEVLVP